MGGKGQKHRRGPVRPGKGGGTTSKPDSSRGRPSHAKSPGRSTKTPTTSRDPGSGNHNTQGGK